ncbi:MAG: Calx-beta domain-containing protein [Acidobacteriota bacterium]
MTRRLQTLSEWTRLRTLLALALLTAIGPGAAAARAHTVSVDEFRVCPFEANFVFNLAQFNPFFGTEVSLGYVVGGGQFGEGDHVTIGPATGQFTVQVKIEPEIPVGTTVQILGQGSNPQLAGDPVFFVQNFNVTTCGDQETVEVLQQTYVVEEGGEAVVGVRLSKASATDVTVRVGLFEDTASQGLDYQTGLSPKVAQPALNEAELVVPAGQTSATARVPIVQDDEAESSERFTFEIVSVVTAGYVVGAAAVTQILILDLTGADLVFSPARLLILGFLLPICIFVGGQLLVAARKVGGGTLLAFFSARMGGLFQIPLFEGVFAGFFASFFYPLLGFLLIVLSGSLVIYETSVVDGSAQARELWRVQARDSDDSLPGQRSFARGPAGLAVCQIESARGFCQQRDVRGTVRSFEIDDIDWVEVLAVNGGFAFVTRSNGIYSLSERGPEGQTTEPQRRLAPEGAAELDLAFDGRYIISTYVRGGGVFVAREEPRLGRRPDRAARTSELGERGEEGPVRVDVGAGSPFSPQIAVNGSREIAVAYGVRTPTPVGGLGSSSLFAATLDRDLQVVGEALLDDGLGEHRPQSPSVSFSNADEVVAVYEGVDPQGDVAGVYSQTWSVPVRSGDCIADAETVCLNEGRFAVTASWQDFQGNAGFGAANQLTPDTGYFTFFDEANVEVVAKVLDACFADRFWVFAAGLTDVQVTLTVEDTRSGQTQQYVSALGESFEPVQDTNAFATCTASSAAAVAPAQEEIAASVAETLLSLRAVKAPSLGTFSAAAQVCGPTTLCLADGRFELEADFRVSGGEARPAQAQALTSDTGFFTFFDAANVEVVVKVLDACAINQNFWVFAGGLTDVEVELRVTDTVTGARATYDNRQGEAFQPVLDTAALSCSG